MLGVVMAVTLGIAVKTFPKVRGDSLVEALEATLLTLAPTPLPPTSSPLAGWFGLEGEVEERLARGRTAGHR